LGSKKVNWNKNGFRILNPLLLLTFMQVSTQIQNSYANIIKLALPICIAILIPQVNILTNTVFLGYYTPTHGDFSTQDLLAASGIAGIYYLTLVMIGYGLASGILMLMSRKAGEGDSQGVGKIFSNGIIMTLSLSAILILASFFIAPMLFSATIQDTKIQAAAISFIEIRYWGLPFILVSQLANSFFLATLNSKLIIVGSIVQTIVNIILDYILIFGVAFFPELGLNGTAFASVCSELACMLSLLLLLGRLAQFKPYTIRYFASPDWLLIKETFIKSSPLIMQYFLSIGAWEIFFIYVEHLGKAESAVSQLLRSVFGIVGVATWALASTCNSMVSNIIGQGKLNEVIPMILKIVKLSFGVSFVLGILVLAFPAEFLRLLTADESLVQMGRVSLRIVVLATWMLSVSTIFFNGVLGTGNTRMNMIFEFVAIFFYVSYITIVIEKMHLPLPYAWASEFVYWSSLFIMSAIYLYSGRWKKANTTFV
jgi:putative MATE family efflux protein